jgi:hypothetical protein
MKEKRSIFSKVLNLERTPKLLTCLFRASMIASSKRQSQILRYLILKRKLSRLGDPLLKP